MHPYRDNPAPPEPERYGSEELVLYVLLVVIGAIPVIVALAQQESLGADATLGLLMTAGGLFGAVAWLVRSAHRRLGRRLA